MLYRSISCHYSIIRLPGAFELREVDGDLAPEQEGEEQRDALQPEPEAYRLAHMYVCVYIYIYICIYIYIYSCSCLFIYIYTHTHTYTHTYIHIHKYTCITYIYIYIHTHTISGGFSCFVQEQGDALQPEPEAYRLARTSILRR